MNALQEKIARIKMLVMDVDGVMTDGGMYYSASGDEMKKFNARDGMGLQLMREAGYTLAIITGENSDIVYDRAKKLQIDETHRGIEDKLATIKDIMIRYCLEPDEVAYIGDDINDLQAMSIAGFAVAVQDAVASVKEIADYITTAKGGHGAVREVCDLILARQK